MKGRSMKQFKVGIDSYSLKPLGLDALGLLAWAGRNGASGVQFSEVPNEAGDPGILREIGQEALARGLYLEWGGGQHIPFDIQSGRPINIAETNRKAAEEAAALGLHSIRSCSGGLMRWRPDDPPIDHYLAAMAASLRTQAPMFRDLGIVLAVETHFEFTTAEIRRLFDMCDAEPGDFLGVCLDTMNLLTLLEDPVSATRRVLPWVVTTHIKDGGILAPGEDFRTFTTETGAGIVDFARIFEDLSSLEQEITLSIEDHGGDFAIPWGDPAFRAKFPDLDPAELEHLRCLARQTEKLMDSGSLAVLDRMEWPSVCEERVRRDIAAVRSMVESSIR
jgi:sugar phosphate isomerase/epimerase